MKPSFFYFDSPYKMRSLPMIRLSEIYVLRKVLERRAPQQGENYLEHLIGEE